MNATSDEDMKALLASQLALLEKSAWKLEQSFEYCKSVALNERLSDNDDIAFEALTARFSRLSDFIVQKIFRTVDIIELDDSGTVRDRINRAEKKGWIKSADGFVEIHTLRNIIAHEYGEEAILTIYKKTQALTSVLLDACQRIDLYVIEKGYKL